MTQIILDRKFFIDVIKDMADLVEKERDYLTKLDSDIGDGDHGVNLSIGFREVIDQLDTINGQAKDINSLLKKVGMILLGKVGGSSGPLYGSFFMKAGQHIAGKDEITFDELVGMINNGVESIVQRGKAQVGDKTMVDAFVPGLKVLNERTNLEPVERFKAFIEAMKEGAESTIPLVAKKGRAMRLGERAIGHKDPGAESAWMLMNVILNNLLKIASPS
ncbi:dihydroxyacetone kinase subunit DhaL [Caldibacillus debilis]|jgi:dihydroxyacetone kinase-like protein|uniref:dihydroxyacetone kinase subunit DhaL n=1 Tax=Caldibacillus debilis TaxID=301148 RepID=UPI002FD90357